MSEPGQYGFRIKPGMTKGRKAPRWTIAFLRALARTGDVRAAAEDAGIDHTTAYLRRRTHPEFAELWRGALVAHEVWVRGREPEKAGVLKDRGSPGSSFDRLGTRGAPPLAPPPPSAVPLPTGLAGREDLVGAGSQVKRVGHDRWSQRKEKLFFDELAATANVKRAAAAAGVSTNAVYQRRMRDPHFKAKWSAVLETGRAAIEMHLVEAANRTFDPSELDTGDVAPKVSVAEAIRIVQAHGSARQRAELADPYAEQAASMTQDDVKELREKIVRKLRRLRDRDMPDMIAAGWSFDEEHDHMVPPGWAKSSPRDGGS